MREIFFLGTAKAIRCVFQQQQNNNKKSNILHISYILRGLDGLSVYAGLLYMQPVGTLVKRLHYSTKGEHVIRGYGDKGERIDKCQHGFF